MYAHTHIYIHIYFTACEMMQTFLSKVKKSIKQIDWVEEKLHSL